MKTLHNKHIVLGLVAISTLGTTLFSTGLVYADDSTNSGSTILNPTTVTASGTTTPVLPPVSIPVKEELNNIQGSKAPGLMQGVKDAKWALKHAREERKEGREVMMEQNKGMKEQIKMNKEVFRTGQDGLKIIFGKFTQDVQVQLRALSKANKGMIDTLRTEESASGTTNERKTAIKTEIKALHDSHVAKILAVVGTGSIATEVENYFTKQKELVTKNQALREETKKARGEFRQGKDEQVEKYRDQYYTQLKSVIPKLKDQKIDDVNKKIDALIAKIEGNINMAAPKKEKFLSQVISIKELLEEEQDHRSENMEDSVISTIIE